MEKSNLNYNQIGGIKTFGNNFWILNSWNGYNQIILTRLVMSLKLMQ